MAGKRSDTSRCARCCRCRSKHPLPLSPLSPSLSLCIYNMSTVQRSLLKVAAALTHVVFVVYIVSDQRDGAVWNCVPAFRHLQSTVLKALQQQRCAVVVFCLHNPVIIQVCCAVYCCDLLMATGEDKGSDPNTSW